MFSFYLLNVLFFYLSESCKKAEINQKISTKNGLAGDDKITPEKNKKIRERLINFLLRRPTLDSLREKGIFKGMHFYTES